MLAELLDDLRAESAVLDDLVAGLSEVDWSRPTPAAGWTIAHQISHLTWTDAITVVAATDPDEFYRRLSAAQGDADTFVDRAAQEGLAPPEELLQRWRDGRERLASTLTSLPAGTKTPWFGTSMSAQSTATARIMETWAHGQDVAETLLGEPDPTGARAREVKRPTNRLRHVAFLGYRTLGWSFLVRGREAPTQPVRVELTGPDDDLFTFGPEGAADLVTGPLLDFCLLVTQRRHRADLALQATGPVAEEWLPIAQAFAGPPGAGREPAGAKR